MKLERIQEAINFIKEQTGYDLSKYVDNNNNSRKYFNISLYENNKALPEFMRQLETTLDRIKGNTIKDVQPNGYVTLAVFV